MGGLPTLKPFAADTIVCHIREVHLKMPQSKSLAVACVKRHAEIDWNQIWLLSYISKHLLTYLVCILSFPPMLVEYVQTGPISFDGCWISGPPWIHGQERPNHVISLTQGPLVSRFSSDMSSQVKKFLSYCGSLLSPGTSLVPSVGPPHDCLIYTVVTVYSSTGSESASWCSSSIEHHYTHLSSLTHEHSFMIVSHTQSISYWTSFRCYSRLFCKPLKPCARTLVIVISLLIHRVTVPRRLWYLSGIIIQFRNCQYRKLCIFSIPEK